MYDMWYGYICALKSELSQRRGSVSRGVRSFESSSDNIKTIYHKGIKKYYRIIECNGIMRNTKGTDLVSFERANN